MSDAQYQQTLACKLEIGRPEKPNTLGKQNEAEDGEIDNKLILILLQGKVSTCRNKNGGCEPNLKMMGSTI